jgi:hypothetical protein
VVLDALVLEVVGVVGLVVEPDDRGDPELLEDGEVVLGGEERVLDKASSTPESSLPLS